MSKSLHLYTQDEEFDKLHEACDKARKGTECIKVSRSGLMHVLMDYQNLLDRYTNSGGVSIYTEGRSYGHTDTR